MKTKIVSTALGLKPLIDAKIGQLNDPVISKQLVDTLKNVLNRQAYSVRAISELFVDQYPSSTRLFKLWAKAILKSDKADDLGDLFVVMCRDAIKSTRRCYQLPSVVSACAEIWYFFPDWINLAADKVVNMKEAEAFQVFVNVMLASRLRYEALSLLMDAVFNQAPDFFPQVVYAIREEHRPTGMESDPFMTSVLTEIVLKRNRLGLLMQIGRIYSELDRSDFEEKQQYLRLQGMQQKVIEHVDEKVDQILYIMGQSEHLHKDLRQAFLYMMINYVANAHLFYLEICQDGGKFILTHQDAGEKCLAAILKCKSKTEYKNDWDEVLSLIPKHLKNSFNHLLSEPA